MSLVYFLETDLQNLERDPKILVKFLEETDFFPLIKNKDLVGMKIHFGEEKNIGYIKPAYIKALVERIKRIGAKPFLFDTNTLYRGKRSNAVDHFNLAFFEHNFKLLNIPVIIGDGLKSKDYVEVDVEGEHFKKARVAPILQDLDILVVLSHLTGHILAGFGASIKNLGMGCASRAGKMDQHCEVSPFVKDDICIMCKCCIQGCLMEAISIKENKIFIDKNKCTGCAQCISECPKGAIRIIWSENYRLLQEKMAEYAKAAASICKNKLFVNFATFITKDCDCMSKEEKGVVSDLGILASLDPLALDKATVDLLNQRDKSDVFRDMYKDVDYNFQFRHAQKIGLGSLDYTLKKITV